MKKDLIISVVVAILGVIISYFVCNIFVGSIETVKVKTIDASVSADIPEPDPELFNYRAINPTVEVYVGEAGNCQLLNSEGQCVYGNQDNQ